MDTQHEGGRAPWLFRRGRMSATQRAIAQYLCDHPWESLTQSAAQIGEAVGVSASTVVRFAQSAGFSGLPELQKVLAREAPHMLRSRESVERVEYASEQLGLQDSATSFAVFEKVLASEITHIQKTQSSVSPVRFEAVVERIVGAETLYVLGLRGSSALAVQLTAGLQYVRPRVLRLDNGGDDLGDRLTSVVPNDLLIAFSYSPYASKTIRVAEAFKSLDADVVVITDSSDAPALSAANEFIVTYNPVWFSSTTGGSAPLVNALVYAVAAKRKSAVSKHVAKARQLVLQLEEFELDSLQNLAGIISRDDIDHDECA